MGNHNPESTEYNYCDSFISETYYASDRLRTVTMGVQTRTFTYDNRGFLLSEIIPEISTQTYSLCGTSAVSTCYTSYDARGNVGSKFDGAHRLDFEYDSFGRPAKVKDNANSTNPLKSYTYGTTNTIVSPVPLTVGVAGERPLHPPRAGGSGLGARERQETDIARTTAPRLSPDSQLPTPDVPNTPGLSEPPAPSPEPLSQNDEPKNASRASLIDYQNGRLISAQSDSPNTIVNGAYTGRTQVIEQYTYAGPMGTVTRKTTTVDHLEAGAASFSQVFTQGYGWNALGQLESVSYPTCAACPAIPGRTVSQSYMRGYVVEVGPYYAKQIVYHPSGMTAKVQHYKRLDTTGSGIQELIEQNTSNRMARPNRMYTDGASDPDTAADADWSTGIYSYDGAGNISGMAADAPLKPSSDTFSYDKVSRLTNVSLSGFGGQAYQYDKYGNLTNYNGYSRAASTTTNQLTAATYDSAGNLTYFAPTNYRYDALNQMRALWGNGQNRVFAYTVDGERILQRDGDTSTITLRDASNKVLRELVYSNGAWGWKKDYIYRSTLLLASEDATEGFHHYHLDHLGSSRLVTMRGGEKSTLFTHWPFGEDTFVPSSSSPQDPEKVRYTGHERDLGSLTTSADDIDYMHARSYGPTLARFMSVDSGNSHSSNPRTWNRYAYSTNNPVILVDPNGKTVWSALELISSYKDSIVRASEATGGSVSPELIARVVFQENMNDFNYQRFDDTTGSVTIGFFAGLGGPEIKNIIASIGANFSGGWSLGIGEMRVKTAANLLNMDSSNAADRMIIVKLLNDPNTAVWLVALELQRLKEARPNASDEVILSDYNRGLSNSMKVTEVGSRSKRYVGLIRKRLKYEVSDDVVYVDGKLQFVNN